jgi:uncharacterized membrane protein
MRRDDATMNMISDLKKAKFLGHPIHTMLIHFPSALLPASVVLDALGYYSKDLSYSTSAYYTLTGGLWAAVIAAVFGIIDYLNIPEEKPSARKKATLHMIMNFTWLSAFGVVWGLRMDEYPSIQFEQPALFVISILAVLLMLISNHFGGDLILRDGIGLIVEDHSKDQNTAGHRSS